MTSPPPQRDHLTRDWATTLGGSMVRLALGLAASVLIARALGPTDFGVYTLLAASVAILSAVADLGLTQAGIKRVAELTVSSPLDAQMRGRAFFWLRVLSAGTVVLVALGLAEPVGRLFGLPAVLGIQAAQVDLIRLAWLGVFAAALTSAVGVLLQATRHFGRLALVMLTNAALTALLALVFAWTGGLTLFVALVWLGIGTALLSFGVGLVLLPRGWRPRWPGWSVVRGESRPLWAFGRWVWLAGVLAMLTANLDLLLVGQLTSVEMAGFYGLALNLVAKVDIVHQTFQAVLLPAVSIKPMQGEPWRAARQGVWRGALVGLGLLLLLPLARPLIDLVYGSAYAPAAGLLGALLVVVLFDLLTTPLLVLVYPLDRPRLLLGAEALRSLTLAVLALGLIPLLGPLGAALARLGGRVAGAGLILVALRRLR